MARPSRRTLIVRAAFPGTWCVGLLVLGVFKLVAGRPADAVLYLAGALGFGLLLIVSLWVARDDARRDSRAASADANDEA